MPRHLYIGIIVPACVLLPIITGILRYPGIPGYLRYVFFYLIVAACINLAAILLAYNNINNLPLLHVLTMAELFFLLYYFSGSITGKKAAAFLQYACWAGILFCLVNAIWLQGIFRFNSYAKGVEALLILVATLLYSRDMDHKLKDTKNLLIISGLLLYFSGSFLLFLFSNSLKKGYWLSSVVWNVNATLVLIMYILIAAGFFKCKTSPTTSTSSSL